MERYLKTHLALLNFKPTLAYLTDNTPDTKDWIHEIKYDGYRVLCLVENNKVWIFSRNNKDLSLKFPDIKQSLMTFPSKNTILDGEMVVLDKRGISSFQLLKNAISGANRNSVILFVFDCPFMTSKNMTTLPLIERKKRLQLAFKKWKHPHENIILTQYVVGQGKKLYKKACNSGLEGIMSKNLYSPYEEKRTQSWLKSKCIKRQEFVIAGFTKPQGSREYFGALLLGVYMKRKLIFCGKVGTGFTHSLLRDIYLKMKPLIRKHSSFHEYSNIARLQNITWLKPQLVAEIKYSEWTQGLKLRHPSFVGLRIDKNPKNVTKELKL